MSNVRRCDFDGCTNGPDGTRAVSDTQNPVGWITASASPIVGHLDGGQTAAVTGDFDTALCAAHALFDQQPSVAVAAAKTGRSGK